MKKTLLIIVSSLVLFSCNFSQMERDKARKAAKDSGIKIDSIIFGVCFNDSPMEVIAKLKEWESHCPSGFEYHFQYPKRLNEFKWTIDRIRTEFYNDILYRFTIQAEIPSYKWRYDGCFEDLDTLYSRKYGIPVRDLSNNSIDWYKGNLNVSLNGIDSDYGDYIYISYINDDLSSKALRNYDKSFSHEKNQYGFNLIYSNEYWNRVYKDAENILIDEASKNI